jgi:hypothetical protein
MTFTVEDVLVFSLMGFHLGMVYGFAVDWTLRRNRNRGQIK